MYEKAGTLPDIRTQRFGNYYIVFGDRNNPISNHKLALPIQNYINTLSKGVAEGIAADIGYASVMLRGRNYVALAL